MDESTYSNRILIADDSKELLDSLKEILHNSGYEVDLALNGATALKKASEKSFDLILTDINMPFIDGLELLNRIKSTINPSVPVILMTGFIKAEFAIKALKLGAADFIGKPIDISQLLNSVEKQITRLHKAFEKNEYIKFLNEFQIIFEFRPKDYLNKNISSFIHSVLKRFVFINSRDMNEILLCIEEMVNNAFIHGVFQVDNDIRSKHYEKYYNYLREKLTDSKIKNHSVKFTFSLDNNNNKIVLKVQDTGNGFNYYDYLQTSYEFLDLQNPSGRGIPLLNLLSDNLIFKDSGRTLIIEKNITRK